MPTLDESYRAPAEVTQKGYVSALRMVLIAAADFLCRCRHHDITLPMDNRQTCLDCGAWRLYFFGSADQDASDPPFIGQWHKSRAPLSDRAFADELLRRAARLNTAINRTPFHDGLSLQEFHRACRVPPPEPITPTQQDWEDHNSRRGATVTHCQDCGQRLDPFGICPATPTQDVGIMSSPVYCGRAAVSQ